ncbi:DEAD/DEAH box helicase [Halobacillus seohaensis]|uniref:DEAD/DEAH box helicase n=1 Tax=Halobacillus seohaensis TaxID=447421 RepID=A0ABW2EJJ7_9BACI
MFHTFPEDSPYKILSGKLLTRDELPFDKEEVDLLIEQSLLHKNPSILSTKGKNICQRCGNEKPYLFARFPHATCHKQDCLYCRNCIMMGRVTICEPLYAGSPMLAWEKHSDPCTWEGELTAGQQLAASRISSAIQNKEELLVWAVCGAGKTEMLFPGLTIGLRLGLRICIATPRTDVVRELLPRLKQAFPRVLIEGLYGDSEEKDGQAQLLVSTTHQLYRFAHAFDVMIIDEIDAFPYHNDPSLQSAAKRAAKLEAAHIYLTATPRKKVKRQIKKKQLPAVFIPARFHGHPLPIPHLKLSPTLRYQLAKDQLPSSITRKIAIQQKGRRQLLLFVSTISYAQIIEQLLKDDYSVASVHAEDPERAEKVQAFRDQKIQIIVTTTILERGVTFPSVDVFVIDAGHHVYDEAALVQIAGRAGRSPADPTGEVVFYHIGKTNAMLDAQEAISKMNRLAKKS